ncbi:MAG: redox-sensing transcriptional repressor Rex [Actinobacteria bacterium]|nr:redox-sensing transcriptional repressor Rex [Actinomycetota bacterium]
MASKSNNEKPKRKGLSSGVVERLSLYLNCLLQFKESGYKYVSSKEIGFCTGINPAEVRRDLIKIGSVGKKGLGYPVNELVKVIQKSLRSETPEKVALVGAGNLGTAIAGFEGISRHGFKIEAIFDIDPNKIGKRINKIPVYDVKYLEEVIKKKNIRIAIIATPKEAALEVFQKLVAAGVRIVINYTDTMIKAPPGVKVHNANPVVEILHTLYFLSKAED